MEVASSNPYPSRPTRPASPADPQAVAAIAVLDRYDFASLAVWEEWAGKSSGTEMRLRALKAVRTCVENRDKSLDLSSLSLTKLPNFLPRHVEELDVSSNALKKLPGNLPPQLKGLRAERNKLESLPGRLPSSLERLQACDNRLTELPALPHTLSFLNIKSNQIRSLPDSLPDNLKTLIVCGNQLNTLPDTLPSGLEHIQANYNKLKRLPEQLPPGLRSLQVDSNTLKALPARMPANLKQIHADQNRIVELPVELPPALEELSVSHNRIRCVPDSLPPNLKQVRFTFNRITDIPMRMTSGIQEHTQVMRLDFGNNPLSSESMARLNELPRLVASSDAARPADPSLTDAVSKWFPAMQQTTIREVWTSIADEPYAGQFARFLNRLLDSIGNSEPRFGIDVARWLLMLSKAPSLRKAVFLIAFDAGETCEDRAALALSSMWTASAVCKLEMGSYDSRIPEFIDHARKIFRSEKLSEVARERVNLMRRENPSTEIDEISIYLSYYAKLHDKLQLLSPVNNMRFFSSHYVQEEELPDVQCKVMENENSGFTQWLSSWSPWEAMLERTDKASYDRTRATLHLEIDQNLEDTITSMLYMGGFPNDEETRQAAAPLVTKFIVDAFKKQLTHHFLSTREQLRLLNPIWSEADMRNTGLAGQVTESTSGR